LWHFARSAREAVEPGGYLPLPLFVGSAGRSAPPSRRTGRRAPQRPREWRPIRSTGCVRWRGGRSSESHPEDRRPRGPDAASARRPRLHPPEPDPFGPLPRELRFSEIDQARPADHSRCAAVASPGSSRRSATPAAPPRSCARPQAGRGRVIRIEAVTRHGRKIMTLARSYPHCCIV
jgi:hypothetical protein